VAALVAVAAVKDEAVTAAQKAAAAKKTIAAGEAVDADAVVNVEAAEAVGAAGCGTRWRNSGGCSSSEEVTKADVTAANVVVAVATGRRKLQRQLQVQHRMRLRLGCSSSKGSLHSCTSQWISCKSSSIRASKGHNSCNHSRQATAAAAVARAQL
jgi:hypothetical protein